MKKANLIVLGLSIVLGFCGCGSEGVSQEEKDEHEKNILDEPKVNNNVEYMSIYPVQHDDDHFTIFFGLKNSKKEYIKSDATIQVKLTNDEGDRLFFANRNINESNYSYIEDLGETLLLASFEINDSEIKLGNTSKGKFEITISGDEFSFETEILETDNLPCNVNETKTSNVETNKTEIQSTKIDEETVEIDDIVTKPNSETGEKNSTLNQQDSELSMGKINALKSAKLYLEYLNFSYEGLIEQLEYEKYTNEESVYAADNCGADWNQQAVGLANSYLEYTSFSYSGLVGQLEYEKFTHDQAVYAADNCGADWKEQAAKCAKSYLEFSTFSRDELIEQLEYEGFTYEQAVYGVEQNGY